MTSMLLTLFAVNGSCIITLHSMLAQGILALDTLLLYIYIMNSWWKLCTIYRTSWFHAIHQKLKPQRDLIICLKAKSKNQLFNRRPTDNRWLPSRCYMFTQSNQFSGNYPPQGYSEKHYDHISTGHVCFGLFYN